MARQSLATWWHNLITWGSFGIFASGPGTESPGVQAPTIVVDSPSSIAILVSDADLHQAELLELLHQRSMRTIEAMARPEPIGDVDRIAIRTPDDGTLLGTLPQEHVAAYSAAALAALLERGVRLERHLWTSRVRVEVRAAEVPGQLATAWAYLPPAFLAGSPAQHAA